MKIRVPFADGTSEERDELSMAHEDPSIPIEPGGVSDYPLYEVRGFSMWFERAGKWEEALIETPNEQVARLAAERDAARAALQGLLDDCATWRAHRSATGMGVHLPHDLMSAPPSIVQHIERAAKRGLGQ